MVIFRLNKSAFLIRNHDASISWSFPIKKMVKGGCWDIPAFIVGCYGFYVVVQCFFLTFDVYVVGFWDYFANFAPNFHCGGLD